MRLFPTPVSASVSRLDPGRLEQLHLLAEGEGHPCDHGQHRGTREDGCRLVQRLELSVDEDPERGQAEDCGQREHPRALGADGAEPAGGLPRGGGEEEHRERPPGVEQLDPVRRADRSLVQDAAVRKRERGRAAEDAQPGSVELPAGDRQDGDDHAEQECVGKRIRHVHRRGQRRAARALDNRAEQDCSAHGGHRERGERRVEPEAALEVHRPRPYEQADPGIEDGIGDEPEHIRHRRRGHRRIQEEERVVEVAGSPEEQRGSDTAPGRPLSTPLVGRGQTDEGCADEQDVVEPPDHLGCSGRLHHEQHEIDREERREAEQEPPAAGPGQGWI